MTETIFGYMILISMEFTISFLRFLVRFSFDREDISNAEDRV